MCYQDTFFKKINKCHYAKYIYIKINGGAGTQTVKNRRNSNGFNVLSLKMKASFIVQIPLN